MGFFFKWLDVITLLLLFLAVGLYLYARASRRAKLLANAKAEVKRIGKNQAAYKVNIKRVATNRLIAFIQNLGLRLPLLSDTQRLEASRQLVSSGYRSQKALITLIGITAITILIFIALTSLYFGKTLNEKGGLYWLLAIVACVYIGSLVPRLAVDFLVRKRQQSINLALPDALDLLVITTNAGLSLNAALERVADEMIIVSPALADEFKYTALQLRVSSDTEAILRDLADRTRLTSVHSLVNTFTQSQRYGTPITKALRILAKSERSSRMMALEEKAAKLAVKITIPMMLFIFPTVLIIAVGPALLNMSKIFSGL